MADGFEVDVEPLRQAGQAFGREKDLPRTLGDRVGSARTVDTGDAGVDAQVASFVDEFATALATLGQLIDSDAIRLDAAAAGYEGTDDAIARDLADIGGTAPPAGVS